MKKKYLVILFAGILMAAGCGKDRAGTYKGKETVQQSGIAAQSSDVTLNVTNGNDNQVNGTYASSLGTGNFTATVSDDGNALQNVRLSMPVTNTGATVNGVPSTGCGGDYTGMLMLNDEKINGTLTLSNPTAPTTYAPTGGYPYSGYTNNGSYPTAGYGCTGASRSLDLTK